jgi:hypothetical protein
MYASALNAYPEERRLSPRLSLDQDVLVSFDAASSISLVARGLDLSLRGVRIRLPIPMPEVAEVRVGCRSDEAWKIRGRARVERVSADRTEVLLLFQRTPYAVARLFERMFPAD